MSRSRESGWLTATCQLRSDTAAHVDALIDCLALQQHYGHIRRLCDRLLSMATWGGAEGGAWRFWRAFAAAAEGDSVAALADLAVLSGDAYALPVTALSIQIHRNAKVKDKELLHSLKCALRAASKSSPPASALLLAARYFLFVGKVSRARQCIEKRIKTERDDAHLLALFAWMDLREAAAAEQPAPEGEEADNGAEEGERAAMEDRARNVLRKAIRIGTAEMRAENSSAAAALSRSHTAAASCSAVPAASPSPSPSPSPSLLLAYFGRASQLHSRGESSKARRELEQLATWFPQCVLALEWRVLATAAEGEWKEAVAVCEAALGRMGSLSAAATPPPRGPDLNESDSVCMRWLVVLHSLLHAPSLAAAGVAAKIADLMSCLRAIEWRNVILLSRFARTLTSLSRGNHGALDASLALLDRAMHVHRQAFPSTAHGEMSRMLVLQGQALLGKGEAAEALESFLEAFVMDEGSAEPTLGQLHALMLLRRFDEAKKLLATLPIAAVRSAAAGGGVAAPPPRHSSADSIVADSAASLRTDFRVSYYRALLAWQHAADADAAAGHMVDALDLHMALMDACTTGQAARANPVLDEEYFPRTNPPLLVGMAALYFDLLGEGWAAFPPKLDADETHAATLLSPLLAVLSRLGLSVPGHVGLLAVRARLEFVQQDYAGCRSSVKKGLALQKDAGSDAAPEQQEQFAQLVALLKRQQSSRPQSPVRGATRKADAGQYEEEKSHPTQAQAQVQLFSTQAAHASRPPRNDVGTATAAAAAASVAATSLFSSRATNTADASAPLPPRARGPPMAAAAPLVVSSALGFDDLVDFDEAEASSSTFARRPPPGPPRTQLQREMDADADRERRRAAAMRRAEEEAREALDMRTSLQREQSNQLSLSFSPSLSPDPSLRQLQPMQPRAFVGLRGGGFGAGGGTGHMSRDDSNSSLAAVSRNSSTASLNSTAHAHGMHHAYLSRMSGGLASSDSNKSVGQSSLAYTQSPGASPGSTPLSMSRQPSEGVLGVTTSSVMSAASLAYYNASPTAAAPPPSLYTSAAERAHGHAEVQSLAFTESTSAVPSPVVPAPRSLESARLQQLKAAAAARAAELEAAAHFLQVARHGCTFWKHGRSGQPHERTVRLEVHSSTDELRFDWGSDRMVVRRSDARLLLGKQSDVMQRDTARRSKPDLCFSVVGPQRTLDLEARNKELRQQWVEGLTALLHREHADPTHNLKQRSSHDSISGPSSSFLGQTHSAPSSVRPSPPSTQR